MEWMGWGWRHLVAVVELLSLFAQLLDNHLLLPKACSFMRAINVSTRSFMHTQTCAHACMQACTYIHLSASTCVCAQVLNFHCVCAHTRTRMHFHANVQVVRVDLQVNFYLLPTRSTMPETWVRRHQSSAGSKKVGWNCNVDQVRCGTCFERAPTMQCRTQGSVGPRWCWTKVVLNKGSAGQR